MDMRIIFSQHVMIYFEQFPEILINYSLLETNLF